MWLTVKLLVVHPALACIHHSETQGRAITCDPAARISSLNELAHQEPDVESKGARRIYQLEMTPVITNI